jgi:hypothetical protein
LGRAFFPAFKGGASRGRTGELPGIEAPIIAQEIAACRKEKKGSMRRIFLALAVAMALALYHVPCGADNSSMKIRLKVGDKVLTATLIDSKTTRDFISLLPLTLTLKDYAGTEKISDLPKRLSTEDAPSGIDPSVGDITYYAPWGNLAIFYRDFGYASGLVILGKIDGRIETFNVPGSVKVTIELIK